MTPDKVKLKFPYIRAEKCRDCKMEEALDEIKFSKYCFVLYEPYEMPVELLFTGFNRHILQSFLVMMGQLDELYKFLKLAVICHEKIGKKGQIGMDYTQRVIKYIDENLNDMIPKKEEEA